MNESLRALRFIYGYPLRYRREIITATVVMFLGLLGNIAVPLLMRSAIDIGVLGGESGSLLTTSLGVLAAGVVTTALLHYGKRMRFSVASKAVNDLREDLFRKLVHLGPADVAEASGGRALTRLISDAVAVRGLTNGGLLELLNQVLVTLAMLITALIIDARTTLLALIPLVFVAIGNFTVQLRLQRAFIELKGQFTKLLAGVGESLANINVVKSYGRETDASDRLNKVNEAHSARDGQMKRTYSRWEAALNVIGGLPTPIALWAGGNAVLAGTSTVGDLVAVVALVMMFQMSIHMLAMHTNGAFRSVVTAQRLLRIIDAPSVLSTREGSEEIPTLGALHATGIEVDIAGRRILDKVDFHVKAGETVALTGPTGSGKSTLLHVLARLRDPDSGTVTYDGADARSYAPSALRRRIVCLPQRQWIFEGTLEDNVRFARPEATRAETADAVEAAGLSHIPLDRRFGASTLDLSAGERQRIGLARVLLVDPEILLLDNPTANLDAETEAELLETVLRVRRGRTLIIASQQAAVSSYVDRTVSLASRESSVDATATLAGATTLEGGKES
ncbi:MULTISPECIES: ABC transporter ATP-binding protein [unclassified Streptomyces]|uniref:ABC transporter ATP-binding protein n=1 Tax=unclassified Streptomyces TaxID=2593676 RepID=UPI00202DDAF9|nr:MULTISPECIES: ABC transporter ATP-binding protein [unclassified Streptomyces]MCM1965375.1 ABC transporter ATP-binding protein/permease [Streptomyces sp. G1]MCX5130034.1 ABC transporter ATP-binding protein/permease [Streptomyces sp. NBC_00347]MCX5301073.1 ABC transporter ATP-binding protein/permease [Streptomyces sp. NBC_00193]